MTNPIYDDKDGSRITCIDAIRAALTIEEYTGFLKGNIYGENNARVSA